MSEKVNMSDRDRTWTYKDYPEFYNNSFIKAIAENEKWTISDKDKRPIDMKAFLEEGKVWGMSFNRKYNPLIDLNKLIDKVPNATNHAYRLEAAIDGFVILDIEPKCPDVIKQELMKLPYIYGETSMSGNGLHLVFELPKDLWKKYPVIHNKLAIKEKHGYYEILLNHMVTLTRNMLPEQTSVKDVSEFRQIFETLAMDAKETQITKSEIYIEDIDTDKIPHYGRTMSVLRAQRYTKKPSDFYNDMSKYEFGMTGFYYRSLMKLLKSPYYKNVTYTDEEIAIILYMLLLDNLEFREKHNTKRNNMPWLLYMTTQLVAKNKMAEEDESTDRSENKK